MDKRLEYFEDMILEYLDAGEHFTRLMITFGIWMTLNKY